MMMMQLMGELNLKKRAVQSGVEQASWEQQRRVGEQCTGRAGQWE